MSAPLFHSIPKRVVPAYRELFQVPPQEKRTCWDMVFSCVCDGSLR